MKHTLYIMVGIPGSGKSHWARAFQAANPDLGYISRDAVRAEFVKDTEAYFSHEKQVYREFTHRIAYWLREKDVIADATHNTEASRNKLVRALAGWGLTAEDYDIVFVCMMTSINTCVARDAERTGRAHVTENVIKDFERWTSWPKITDYPNIKGAWVVHE